MSPIHAVYQRAPSGPDVIPLGLPVAHPVQLGWRCALRILSRAMVESRLLALAAFVAVTVPSVGCGPSKHVVAFSASPSFVCPGEHAVVSWDVQGRAMLREERDAGDWEQGEVLSKGRLELSPALSTSFTITALDAKPAEGQSFATRTIQVPSESDRNRGAVAPCDAGQCAGAFSFDTKGGAKVAKVRLPRLTRLGQETPVALTVTHGTWVATVPAQGEVAANVPAQGTWTLSFALPAGSPPTPPPLLSVTLDFDCN